MFFKGSYDAILKTIILCMYKKHIIFQILCIIVVTLCPAPLKRVVSIKPLLPTSAVCSDWPTDTVHCDYPNTSTRWKCNTPYHNHELQLSS